MSLGFCLNNEKHFFLEVFSQPTERTWVPLKNGTRDFFKTALHLQDQHIFM